MSHLIMLAPANFGSALAQLGKGRIGRLKSWVGGVEPGQGVLDWLELGSAESWDLNSAWIGSDGSQIGAGGIFPFVLTGQTIDRKLYDHLNAYTGESGSDGVVRVAAADLNARLIHLEQETPKKKGGAYEAPELDATAYVEAPETATRVVRKASHSGKDMGIMRDVSKVVGSSRGRDVVESIIECFSVRTKPQYNALLKRFAEQTDQIQKDERLEVEDRLLLSDTYFIHDRYSMVIFRVHDDQGHAVTDFDMLLTAGKNGDPNLLPRGFFVDRQRNSVSRDSITYFINYDVMKGAPEVRHKNKVIRAARDGAEALGVRIIPRPAEGFVHYLPCEIRATKKLLDDALKPNSTTLIDIELKRVVRKNAFRMSPMKGDSTSGSFKNTKPGDEIAN
jgi:hypothetical protein